ncbi:MAG: TonB-dependent receptor [Saprospiraceae bacterium]|nr:TonB-dependent receptor [Saprospiraceae bacterium]
MKEITLLFTLLFTTTLYSQVTIKGTITSEENESIIGANLFLKDTYDGGSTDENGNFEFVTYESGEQIFVVTYIGFETLEKIIQIGTETVEINAKIIEEANELNTVTITAGAFEASDEKKAVILTSLDIVTTAGASADITGALNTLPGTQTVGEDGRLFVRGGAAYETRTFIDGLYVQNPYGSSVPDVPARGRFSPFLFKGTMFSTGGYSAEYGQALSSALILNSQDLAAETSTGLSLMTIGLAASHTHRWENTSLSASGTYTNLAPYLAIAPQQNIQWDKPFQGTNGQVIFRHKTSETGIFKIHADATRNWFEMQYPDLSDIKNTNQLSLTNDNYYVNTSFKELLSDKWTFFAGAAYTYNKDFIREKFQVQTEEQSLQGRATLTNYINEKITLKFGGEYLKNVFEEGYNSEDGEEFLTDLNENYTSGFAETNIYFSRKFVVRVGGRLEYSDILNQWNVAPRLSLAYKASDYGNVSFAFGQFYQTPEKDQLRYNLDLNFERADHYMVNYQIMKGTKTFRIEGYYKKYKNLVKFDLSTPSFSDNSGDGHAQGIDVFYRDRGGLIKNGDFWISYSFLDTERYWREYPTAATPSFASRHNTSLVYKHWFPKLTSSMGLTYSLASPRPYNDPNTNEFNAGETPAFQDLSFNWSYLTNILGHFTVVHISANNILGFNNTFGYRFSSVPNDEGDYESFAVKPPAKRFFFIGCFISIGQKYSKDNGVTSN